ncbi:SusD/RagB family nutrient-binding outer membrane lipoprotein [Pseudoflavitalea sp. G-6-1-2]|uniref:SusD/RagB family nutrient-binding outer membrane lipoprotein n=1 Tax=Pseudoflavitalea sp. G-6-1-2 TaxID=2728841 RepID=UPI00146ACE6F|nr:SusD/RagB family nutrient-binding outer membrane lipoprotein [Pseudoflavitalea sp. G-6-1-2]NML21326.1 SusD/RagB family nutrient-binding outer membrane lipoprotein [Pseudoflavitalea sp. G-6-1-2]
MINKLFLWLLCALTVASAGCSKSSFLDINTDPNNPTDPPPSVLLTYSTLSLGFTSGNELGRVASVLIQHNAGVGSQMAGFESYNLNGNFDGSWDFEIYAGALPAIDALIAKTQGVSPHYSGIAKIQKAYVFSIATDLWGDVPYSQAGQLEQFKTPRYDKQEDIYQGNSAAGIRSLFDLVKEGIADLKQATPAGGFEVGAENMVFMNTNTAGIVNGWIRIGNTLLLKLANTISNVNPTLARTIISEVLADGNYIKNNSEDMDIRFGTDVNNQSPVYSFNQVNRDTDMLLSQRFLNLIVSLKAEAYLAKMYTKPSGAFIGFDNGSNNPLPPLDDRSRYAPFVGGIENGVTFVRMLSNAQRAFILAESALMLGTTGDANALFQEGIKAGMAKSGLSNADINNYFTANPTLVTLTGSNEDKLKQIITWKYIANVPNPLEAYNDFRRTGYPVLTVSQNAGGDNASVIPKRYTYSPNETAANPNQPKPRPKTDVKVWWAK